MDIKQSNLFKQSYKKLHKNQLEMVNTSIRTIIAQPEIGELKCGDLTNIRVYKFKLQAHMWLLAYEHCSINNSLYLMALGEHENFYNKLKKHLKFS